MGGGGTDDNEVFASLTNFILAKIQDEDEKEDGDTYDFQSMTFAKDGDEEFESNEQLFERINALYRRALKSKLYILDENELQKSYVIDSKKFSLSKLKYAVQRMEGLSFVDGKNSLSGKDILGDFFESHLLFHLPSGKIKTTIPTRKQPFIFLFVLLFAWQYWLPQQPTVRRRQLKRPVC